MTKRESRSLNTIRNSIASIIYNVFNIILSFILQSYFIKILGVEYNGIKSLFLNILSMLSIIELGFGSAIIYNLYSPIQNKDNERVKQLLGFYKLIYNIISLIILLIGLCLMPFLDALVGENSIQDNIYIIYILYLLNTVSSYLLTYKRSVLYANQHNYIINIFDTIFLIIRTIIQILILKFIGNIYIFIIIQILSTLFENICISIFVNKKYSYLVTKKHTNNIDEDTKKDIFKKVKGLLFHKIGSFIVTGTDNILISTAPNLGIVYVGLYSNYNMIIYNVSLILNNIMNSATSSIGNLLSVEKEYEKKIIQTYNSITLVNSWMYCLCGSIMLAIIEPFISIWLGKEFLLPNTVLIVLIINFYINGMKKTSDIFKTAAGIFYEDRFVPIIESIFNIAFSLIFLKFCGLSGIFLGTICSSFVLLFYSYPKYMYSKIIDKSISKYFYLILKHTCISFFSFFIVYIICKFVTIRNIYLLLIAKFLISFLVPNIIYFAFMFKSDDFKYLIKILLDVLKKRKEKVSI